MKDKTEWAIILQSTSARCEYKRYHACEFGGPCSKDNCRFKVIVEEKRGQ